MKAEAVKLPIRYNDLYFRLIISLLAAHFITVFGEKESVFQLFLDKYYYMALGGSFIIAFILVTLIHFITGRLDRRWDWESRTLVRTALQFLFGQIIPSIAAFLLATLYFVCYGVNILQTLYLRIDYPLIVLMLFVFNVYYFAYYYFLRARSRELQITDRSVAEEINNANGFIIVNDGSEKVLLYNSSIAYFAHIGEHNFVRTLEGRDYLISQSLDELQLSVDPQLFFRANRQMLVNIASCKSFQSIENGKLLLSVTPPVNDPVIVSQKRAKEFKDWIAR